MANEKQLTILINAKDNASREISKVGGAFDTLKTTTISLSSVMKTAAFALTAVGGGIAYALKKTTDASNELNNAMIGLNSVAKAFKQDTDIAKQAAIDLAKDGLMSVKDAAAGLKNLLATGFSLPEAINLMKAFKDSAAFNRQGTLEFGQAIEGATQGIKNQNSIMVDNAGITKNLSIILKEAGYSQQDLMNVTSDASVRQALYNGIMKEASIFQGDAARMSETLAGRQAALATQIFMVKAAIGEALAPVMSAIVQKIMEMINSVGGPEGITAKMLQYQDTIMSVVELLFALIQVIGTVIGWWFQFVDVLDTVINKAEAAYKAITKLASALGGNVINAWKNLPANLGFGGGRAIGGPVSAGTSYLVGEKGPEMFVPSTSGTIIPNGGGGLVINITGNTLLDNRAAEKIGDMIVNKLGMSTKYAY
jgi:hypothetical protein